MNQPQPEKPIELKIDVEQWRRDIQTFIDTTIRALDAIAAELSNGCSGRFDEHATRSRDTSGRDHARQVRDEPTNVGTIEPVGDDRLAKLKAQLAQRISKSN